MANKFVTFKTDKASIGDVVFERSVENRLVQAIFKIFDYNFNTIFVEITSLVEIVEMFEPNRFVVKEFED